MGGGVQGAWTTFAQCSPRDRASSDPLLRDFVMWTPGYPADTFQLRGLPPGDYNLTLYSTDTSYPTSATIFDIDGNNDNVNEISVTIQAALSETTKTVAVTISSAGIVSIKGGAYNGKSGVCNGFDLISAAPDIYPPAPVGDLAASLAGTVVDRAHKVTLNWTAPADDNGAWGKAARVGRWVESRCGAVV